MAPSAPNAGRTRSAWAVVLALAAMLVAGWASLGHEHVATCACRAAHEHECVGHDDDVDEASCDAHASRGERHRDERSRDEDRESDDCALCKVLGRIPNTVPTPTSAPEVAGVVSIVILDAPDAPSVRRPRPRLPRGPPGSFAS